MAITCTVTRGFTFATGVDLSSANLNELGEPTVTVPALGRSATGTEFIVAATRTKAIIWNDANNSGIAIDYPGGS